MSAGHSHGEENLSDRALIGAVALNGLLTVAQIVGGILSGSLALIADALHNFSDAASLGLALVARRIGRRPADKLMTFGYARAEIVAALINLTTLLIIGFYLLVEAVNRYADPQPIEGGTVIWVAGIALVIDVLTAVIVYRGTKGSLNMKAAFLHNVSDALASVGVIAAGALILLYDLYIADLIITVIIAAYVIYQGISLLPKTVRLLMGAVPDEIEFDRIVDALRSADGVKDVHHVHIWSISEHERALETHIVPVSQSLEAFEDLKRRARTMLLETHRISHATFEACMETDCEPEVIAPPHGQDDHDH
ncbi:cation diffusion facilitator family transporter [Pacificimonas flava]|uniref:Cobalt-zinc-cadmium resistance protein CzcD n=1 Tax=Pacificimonas flava TaxID=1234595 RepID=M2U5S2_9SPHN|nr:cation diffusion facilitator family transporter [Pacificimonas flava]EMD83338.1 Cobalt-zinc-cadmium resistance protein CzcD [Pacificimonas flava]MBB5279103.1 cobalt-zinc-cadmium efflux system protein [Pacificimonas flava]